VLTVDMTAMSRCRRGPAVRGGVAASLVVYLLALVVGSALVRCAQGLLRFG
jgi:hypothetical protein